MSHRGSSCREDSPLCISVRPLIIYSFRFSPFSGSLLAKRKPELVEIADALDISEPDARMSSLVKKIQAHLESNESTLSRDLTFKGLYVRRREWVWAFPHHCLG